MLLSFAHAKIDYISQTLLTSGTALMSSERGNKGKEKERVLPAGTSDQESGSSTPASEGKDNPVKFWSLLTVNSDTRGEKNSVSAQSAHFPEGPYPRLNVPDP